MAGWSDEIILIQTELAKNGNRLPYDREIGRRTVYGDIGSVTRSEFYLANQSGKRADITVILHKEEYHGEHLIEADGGKYELLRSFSKGPEKIELVCTDLSRPERS